MGLPGSYFPRIRTFWEWFGPDKIVHLIVFSIFAFLSIWGYRSYFCQKDKKYRNKTVFLTLLITIAYGGLTELLQKYVFIGRNGSIYDFLTDVIACILGVFIFVIVYQKKISNFKADNSNYY